MSAPVCVASYICNAGNGCVFLRISLAVGYSGDGCPLTFLISVTHQTFLPHRRKIAQLKTVSKILLSNLELNHRLCLLQSAEKRTERLAWLKVDWTVLYLNDNVVAELSVEWHKLLISLLCSVAVV